MSYAADAQDEVARSLAAPSDEMHFVVPSASVVFERSEDEDDTVDDSMGQQSSEPPCRDCLLGRALRLAAMASSSDDDRSELAGLVVLLRCVWG